MRDARRRPLAAIQLLNNGKNDDEWKTGTSRWTGNLNHLERGVKEVRERIEGMAETEQRWTEKPRLKTRSNFADCPSRRSSQ
jgi:hypothetical protein